jgi:hypothetical protein
MAESTGARLQPQIPPEPEIPQPLRSRLAGVGVVTLRKWALLTERQKASIFGITGRHRRLLDELSRQVRP